MSLKGYGSRVWIMGYGSHVVPGYGSEPYILSCSHMFTCVIVCEILHRPCYAANYANLLVRSSNGLQPNDTLKAVLRTSMLESVNLLQKSQLFGSILSKIHQSVAVQFQAISTLQKRLTISSTACGSPEEHK